MDRFFASRVSSSSNAAQSARQLSSIDDVRRWLTTLTEVTSTQKLESLRAAVNVLKKPELKIPSMCDKARCVAALIRVYGIVRAGRTVCVWR